MKTRRARETPARGEDVALAVGVAGLVLFLLALAGHAAAAPGVAPEPAPFGEAAAPDPAPLGAPAGDSETPPARGSMARGLVQGARKALLAADALLGPGDGEAPGFGAEVTELLTLALAAAGGR
jgi:hypothetical protein